MLCCHLFVRSHVMCLQAFQIVEKAIFRALLRFQRPQNSNEGFADGPQNQTLGVDSDQGTRLGRSLAEILQGRYLYILCNTTSVLWSADVWYIRTFLAKYHSPLMPGRPRRWIHILPSPPTTSLHQRSSRTNGNWSRVLSALLGSLGATWALMKPRLSCGVLTGMATVTRLVHSESYLVYLYCLCQCSI